MASSAIYQSPPTYQNPGSWGWMAKPSLQLENYHHIRPQFQFYSSEQPNKMLESTKSSIPVVGGAKDSSVFRNIEKPNYFVENKLQKPVDKSSDIATYKLPSPANFRKEIKQPYPKDLSKPEISSCRLSNQFNQKSLDSNFANIARKPANLISILPNPINQPITKPLIDAMCFLCRKNIKEDHFEKHLFFGAVRCTQCHEEILDCQRFQLMLVNNKMGIVSCKHSLQYCSDPFDYISANLSGDSTGNMNGSLVPSYVLKKLSYYVDNLGVLENKDPWKLAISQCRTLLPSAVTKPSGNMKLSNSNTNIVKSKPFTTLTPLQDSSYDKNKDKLHTMGKERLHTMGKERLHTMGKETLHATKDFEIRKGICSPMKQNGFRKQIPEGDVGDLLMSQSYGIEQLEQSVEYVEVAGHCKLPHSNNIKKPRPYKKQKGIKSDLSPLVIGNDEPEEEITEFIETPANGHYYVIRQAIEECPMCYTVLCPSEFTVNINTFLMTTVCSDCSLTIYIVLESPDGVSIVTEDSLKAPAPSSSKENKKRKYTKREKPLKYSKAKDFFAK